MKKLIFTFVILGLALPSVAEEVDEAVNYYSIPEYSICFKKTVVLDSLEPIGNGSEINLSTFSVKSEIVDCSKIDDKLSIISKKNNRKPILVNGSGKVVEYISSIDTETNKIGEIKTTFQKSDLFEGKGIMFDSLSNKCFAFEIDLEELNRNYAGNGFIQKPKLSTTEKSVNCSTLPAQATLREASE